MVLHVGAGVYIVESCNLYMKIFNYGLTGLNKRTVYLDVDDVVLRSAQVVVDILNQQRVQKGLQIRERESYLHDWGFKSIDRTTEKEWVEQVFDSDEFFSLVQFNQDLIDAWEFDENDPDGLFNSYNWVMITKGNDDNLEKKFELLFSSACPFLERHKEEIGYYGLNLHEDKHSVHMLGGIQIDDNYYNLRNTDAELKILLKNGIETDYNMICKTSDNLQNLYIADNVSQVVEILKFISDFEMTGDDFLEDIDIELGETFDYLNF